MHPNATFNCIDPGQTRLTNRYITNSAFASVRLLWNGQTVTHKHCYFIVSSTRHVLSPTCGERGLSFFSVPNRNMCSLPSFNFDQFDIWHSSAAEKLIVLQIEAFEGRQGEFTLACQM
jgi:hypothetical protein